MPSPLAHSAMGYLIARVSSTRAPSRQRKQSRSGLLVLLAAVFFSLLPDIDILPGLLIGDFGAFHNQSTHSLLVGLAVALVVGFFASWRKASFWFWFTLPWISYSLHVLMDAFTMGRGVMLFWPLTDQRFVGPFNIFMGVRWSEGIWSEQHLLTLVSEVFFAGFVYFAAWIFERVNKARASGSERRLAEVFERSGPDQNK